MFAVPFLSETMHRIGEARARHKTERLLRSLPLEIQKDIGWPDVTEQRQQSTGIAARNNPGILPGHA